MNLEQARQDVTTIFEQVLRDLDPVTLTQASLELEGDVLDVRGMRHLLSPTTRVVLLGVGKSSVGMARGVESVLGDRLDHGVVVTKSGMVWDQDDLKRTKVLQAAHPVPDLSSVTAGERLLSEARGLTQDDLAIVVVSGGGSSLVELPVDGITLDEFTVTTSILLRSGADIWTLNAVRRRLSRIKAGGFARAAAPARVVNLILSDVLGNPLSVIASGLSVNSDGNDEHRIEAIQSSSIWTEFPESVRGRLTGYTATSVPQLENVVQSVIVGDARLAARAAQAAATLAGYRTFLTGARFAGDAREFGHFWAQLALAADQGPSSIPSPVCLIGAGEMTVNVNGDGRGGRNTEMASSASFDIAGNSNIVIASLATDGDDGSSGAAGGVVNGETIQVLLDQGVDPQSFIDRSDTRAFLESSGGLIVTGQTGTNVNDLYLALVVDQHPPRD